MQGPLFDRRFFFLCKKRRVPARPLMVANSSAVSFSWLVTVRIMVGIVTFLDKSHLSGAGYCKRYWLVPQVTLNFTAWLCIELLAHAIEVEFVCPVWMLESQGVKLVIDVLIDQTLFFQAPPFSSSTSHSEAVGGRYRLLVREGAVRRRFRRY